MDGAIKAVLNQDRNSTCVGAMTCYNICTPFILPLCSSFYCWMGFLQKKLCRLLFQFRFKPKYRAANFLRPIAANLGQKEAPSKKWFRNHYRNAT